MTSAALGTLFENIQKEFPSSLGIDAWYLAVVSSLVACGKQHHIADLYLYLVEQEGYGTRGERKKLSLRLRDALLKESTIVGSPKVIGAVAALAKVEKDEDVDGKGTKESVKLDEALYKRGTAAMAKIYRDNLQPIFDSWGSHAKDFEWFEKSIVYGVFLSDNSVLSDVETELVVLPGIMCQGLKGPTMWHLRGMRRLGVTEEDVEHVQVAVENVAKWAGVSVEGWVRVRDIEGEV